VTLWQRLKNRFALPKPPRPRVLEYRPEVIVGALRAADTPPGSQQARCAACGRELVLWPDSGAWMAARWPDVPVICPPCDERIDAAGGPETGRPIE
jgi:hypothetical protein